MKELQKNYDPHAMEEKWSRTWLENKHHHSVVEDDSEAYCMFIPPPNVTGILHMGHALNNTIQDVLVRWRRMQGRNTVWVPGTDHAGIATQNVVERALSREGLSRDDLGREEFIKRVWQWKDEYGSTIIGQLKRLGASCDWQRERFTMDEGLSNAVREVFVRLYEKGLIYRGEYIINWCPRCRTALSDEESEHVETSGKLYYIRYPTKDCPGREHVVVATTRPETMLGDVAVAVNAADPRYGDLVGKTLVLPLLERELAVVADDFVDPEFGTGAVKVTPAHDPNDFEMGRNHDLRPVNIMREDGTMNEEAGPYAGMDRFECRAKILEDLAERDLLEKTEDHVHAVGRCYRCNTVVEPRLSKQWFVKMPPLAARAIEVVKDGRVRFVPERWTKVYLEWMENIRDWCISRQIWWGHRIPVFYCDGCGREWADRKEPDKCPKCGSKSFRQDPDVLDTWFSSWLWPFSTLGWPASNEDLEFYYPGQDMITASEIIFFWIARMIMAGLEFMDDIPFSRVYIHGTVRDDKGRKMSKSLGNALDPLSVIEEFSADALRFSLIMIAATGQDVYLSNDKFEIGRNFGTKIWNAARFMQMHSKDFAATAAAPDFGAMELSPDDQYVIWGLRKAIAACEENLERFRFNDYALTLYEFVWHQFCDWYVEYSKTALYGDDTAARQRALAVMHYVFSSSLRLLQPLMPFLTEELWHAMEYGAESETIACAAWPQVVDAVEMEKWGVDRKTVSNVGDKYDMVRTGRTLRMDYGIHPTREIEYIIRPANAAAADFIETDRASVSALLRASNVKVERDFEPDRMTPTAVAKMGTIYMPVEGLIDVAAELDRLRKELDKASRNLATVNNKLGNMNFVEKAPPEVVERERTRRAELLEKVAKLNRLIETLSG